MQMTGAPRITRPARSGNSACNSFSAAPHVFHCGNQSCCESIGLRPTHGGCSNCDAKVDNFRMSNELADFWGPVSALDECPWWIQ